MWDYKLRQKEMCCETNFMAFCFVFYCFVSVGQTLDINITNG